MNCQEISSLLDDRDIYDLSEMERRVVEAHLPVCAACAREWAIQQRLIAGVTPSMPTTLAAQCRVLVAAQAQVGADTQSRRPAGSRLILLSTALAIAAAAAVLFLRLNGATEPLPAVPASAPPVADLIPASVASAASPAADSRSKAKPHAKVVESVSAHRMRPFTVFVRAFSYKSDDPVFQTILEAYYRDLLETLRNVPGVILAGSSQAPDLTEQQSEIVITVTCRAEVVMPSPVLFAKWSVGTATEGYRIDAQGVRTSRSNVMSFTAGPNLASDREREVARTVAMMRALVFPFDPSVPTEFQSQLGDPHLDFDSRLRALYLLQTMSGMRNDDKIWNINIVRNALELASLAPDQNRRREVMRNLQGAGQVALVQPLIDMLRREGDEQMRLEIVTTLATNFSGNPSARAALEAIAKDDSRELVRKVAQRVVSGDSDWNQYVLSTLKDNSLSDIRRIEPLVYMTSGPTAPAPYSISKLLDDDGIEVLAALIPRTWNDAGSSTFTTMGLLNVLGGANRALELQLLTDVSHGAPTSLRYQIVSALAQFQDEPRVHAKLLEMAADDPDMTVRQRAVEMLGQKGKDAFSPPVLGKPVSREAAAQ